MKALKKYAVLGVVALLLAGAVYMNVKLSSGGSDAQKPDGQTEAGANLPEAGETTEDYFETYRNERDRTRELELGYLKDSIAVNASDDEALADAEEARLTLIANMEKELVMESLIKAKGFEDAAVMFRQGAVDVVVKAAELDAAQAAQILNIVIAETGLRATNINVIPYG